MTQVYRSFVLEMTEPPDSARVPDAGGGLDPGPGIVTGALAAVAVPAMFVAVATHVIVAPASPPVTV